MSLFSFMLGLHFLITILLIMLVLLQKTDSDGSLTSNQNTLNGTFSSHGHASFVVNATWVLAALFAVNCLVLAKLASYESGSSKIFDVPHAPHHIPAPQTTDTADKHTQNSQNNSESHPQQHSQPKQNKPSQTADAKSTNGNNTRSKARKPSSPQTTQQTKKKPEAGKGTKTTENA